VIGRRKKATPPPSLSEGGREVTPEMRKGGNRHSSLSTTTLIINFNIYMNGDKLKGEGKKERRSLEGDREGERKGRGFRPEHISQREERPK